MSDLSGVYWVDGTDDIHLMPATNVIIEQGDVELWGDLYVYSGDVVATDGDFVAEKGGLYAGKYPPADNDMSPAPYDVALIPMDHGIVEPDCRAGGTLNIGIATRACPDGKGGVGKCYVYLARGSIGNKGVDKPEPPVPPEPDTDEPEPTPEEKSGKSGGEASTYQEVSIGGDGGDIGEGWGDNTLKMGDGGKSRTSYVIGKGGLGDIGGESEVVYEISTGGDSVGIENLGANALVLYRGATGGIGKEGGDGKLDFVLAQGGYGRLVDTKGGKGIVNGVVVRGQSSIYLEYTSEYENSVFTFAPETMSSSGKLEFKIVQPIQPDPPEPDTDDEYKVVGGKIAFSFYPDETKRNVLVVSIVSHDDSEDEDTRVLEYTEFEDELLTLLDIKATISRDTENPNQIVYVSFDLQGEYDNLEGTCKFDVTTSVENGELGTALLEFHDNIIEIKDAHEVVKDLDTDFTLVYGLHLGMIGGTADLNLILASGGDGKDGGDVEIAFVGVAGGNSVDKLANLGNGGNVSGELMLAKGGDGVKPGDVTLNVTGIVGGNAIGLDKTLDNGGKAECHTLVVHGGDGKDGGEVVYEFVGVESGKPIRGVPDKKLPSLMSDTETERDIGDSGNIKADVVIARTSEGKKSGDIEFTLNGLVTGNTVATIEKDGEIKGDSGKVTSNIQLVKTGDGKSGGNIEFALDGLVAGNAVKTKEKDGEISGNGGSVISNIQLIKTGDGKNGGDINFTLDSIIAGNAVAVKAGNDTIEGKGGSVDSVCKLVKAGDGKDGGNIDLTLECFVAGSSISKELNNAGNVSGNIVLFKGGSGKQGGSVSNIITVAESGKGTENGGELDLKFMMVGGDGKKGGKSTIVNIMGKSGNGTETGGDSSYIEYAGVVGGGKSAIGLYKSYLGMGLDSSSKLYLGESDDDAGMGKCEVYLGGLYKYSEENQPAPSSVAYGITGDSKGTAEYWVGKYKNSSSGVSETKFQYGTHYSSSTNDVTVDICSVKDGSAWNLKGNRGSKTEDELSGDSATASLNVLGNIVTLVADEEGNVTMAMGKTEVKVNMLSGIVSLVADKEGNVTLKVGKSNLASVVIDGNLSLTGDLSVKGKTMLGGDVLAKSDVNVKGALTVGKSATVKESLSVGKGVTVTKGNVDVKAGNVSAIGVTATGIVTAKTVTAMTVQVQSTLNAATINAMKIQSMSISAMTGSFMYVTAMMYGFGGI